MVVHPHDPALHERPKRINPVRMHIPVYILPDAVIDRAMVRKTPIRNQIISIDGTPRDDPACSVGERRMSFISKRVVSIRLF